VQQLQTGLRRMEGNPAVLKNELCQRKKSEPAECVDALMMIAGSALKKQVDHVIGLKKIYALHVLFRITLQSL
jgi:hypothetical protein